MKVLTKANVTDEAGFAEVVGLIAAAQQRAFQAVNTTLIDLYWQVGEYISRKIETAEWGEGVVPQLAQYIAQTQPGQRGFTRSNLFRMKQFYETYRSDAIVAPLARQLPWTHNLIILGQSKRPEEREFYLRMAVRERWTKRDLEPAATSKVEWLYKTAPGRKSELVSEADVVSATGDKGTGAVGVLRRLIELVRTSFPKARIRVRLDGGFASPVLFEYLDAEPKVEYVVGMASNAVLTRYCEEAMSVARLCSGLTDGTEHVYGDTRYAAKSWKRERRVIIKAEVVKADGKEARDNPRFVITNMKQSPRWLYEEVYCQRGDVENRIKELKALDVDRTSCTNFWANQLRVLMAATAYVLLQEIRLNAALTSLARAQVWTLRERLLKLGARVVASVRRIVVHLPESFPWRNDFQKIAAALGATAG
jgi:predicted nuclease of restriction endonuclease-like (RecB) superfamily